MVEENPGTQPHQILRLLLFPTFETGIPGSLPHIDPGGNFRYNGGGGKWWCWCSHPNGGPGGDGGAGIQYPTTFRDPSNGYGAAGPGSPYGWFAGGGGGATSQITQVLQQMDLLLDSLVEQNNSYAGGGRGTNNLQVQQPSTHKVEEQTKPGGGGGGGNPVPGTTAAEVNQFLALVDLVLYWLLYGIIVS